MTPIPSPRSHRRARLEIIPLIDIMFFLLATFVMVSLSMVKNRGLAVNLPATASGEAQAREDSATLTITAKGEVFFNQQPVTGPQLEAELKALSSHHPEARVLINGDRHAEFGQAIGLLDRVRQVGITKVAIETQPKPAP